MSTDREQAEPFRFSSPRQERIHRRLSLIGQGPAAFYKDACALMQGQPQLDATTHLVAHLLREIESAMRDVLEVLRQPSGDGTRVQGAPDGHRQEIVAIAHALELDENGLVVKAWLDLAGADNPYNIAARVHRDSLALPRPLDDTFIELWHQFEGVLDKVLDRFESKYLATHEFVDHLLEHTRPALSDAQRVRNHVPNNRVSSRYFFEQASSAWLIPLRDAGFFVSPPPPEHDEERGTIGFPVWPESRYLARTAAACPADVCEIMLQMPHTENVRVHEDLADAACTMPPAIATRLAEKEAEWIASQRVLYFLLPSKLGKLLSHLAEGGQVDTALALARHLLAVLPDPRFQDKDEQYPTLHLSPDPRARWEDYYYQEILTERIPELLEAAPLDTLRMLCDLLDTAVVFSLRPEYRDQPEDLSHIWRPAIEDHEQNSGHGIKDHLVLAVRDAAECLMATYGDEVLRAVEGHGFSVFKRVGLHLRRRWPNVDSDGTAGLVTDADVFGSHVFHHELFLLLEECYEVLPPEAQQRHIELVALGPDFSRYRYPPPDQAEDETQRQEIERFVRHWTYEKLQPIEVYLRDEWRERFGKLRDEFGEDQHPEFLVYSGGVEWGPKSPKSAEELQAMTFQEILQFLGEWEPSGEWMEPSPEGLGRQLSAAVAEDPVRFAPHAELFRELDPTYVCQLLVGLYNAAKQGRSFEWENVIELCAWVLSRPVENEEQPGTPEREQSWRWTRKEIARLVGVGCSERQAGMLFGLRENAWQLLEQLAEHPDPTQERETESTFDPLTLSINCIRGEALDSVVRYALWVRRNLGETGNDEQVAGQGFGAMPEVRCVLDRHLDPSEDPSLAVRAVYGRRFPQFVVLDSGWAEENVSRVFPRESGAEALRDAAWETYIRYCSPYDNVFRVLADEYASAIQRIGGASGARGGLRTADERLGEHLMVFYWRGLVELADGEDLLPQFHGRASPQVRKRALDSVGRSLENTEEEVPEAILARLRALWEARVGAVRGSEAREEAAELTAFGSWFRSGKFDDSWAIEQLQVALSLAGQVEHDFMVVKRLAELADEMPLAAVQCLRLIVEGQTEAWGVLGLRDEARQVLLSALGSGNSDAENAATDLVHRLGALGHLEFRDLLTA